MALEFHFEDTAPQVWLNELHSFNIVGVWNPQLKPQQRQNLIERGKQDLKNWRLSLRDQIETIQMRYGDDKKDEIRLMLAPYRSLDDLGSKINTAIKDLESKIKDGRALPLGIQVEDYIFGSLETGRWFFGDDHEMKLWEEFEVIERRYLRIKEEYDAQSTQYKTNASRVKEHQEDIKKLTKEYKARKGIMQLGLRLLVVFIFSLFSLALGILAFVKSPFEGIALSNEAFGGVMLIIGLVGVMIAIVLTRRRRRRIVALREEILSVKSDTKTLKQQAQRAKKALFPTQQTYKEIRARYNEYRAAFK